MDDELDELMRKLPEEQETNRGESQRPDDETSSRMPEGAAAMGPAPWATVDGVADSPERGRRQRQHLAVESVNRAAVLGGIVRMALWLNAAFWAVRVSVGFGEASGLYHWGGTATGGWMVVVVFLYRWVFLGTVIGFILWSYLAHSNLRLVGRSGMRHKDHAAIWSWFVPFANLVVPFQIVYETIRGTVAPPEDRDWLSHRLSRSAAWWTGCFLAGPVILRVSTAMLDHSVTSHQIRSGAAVYALGAGLMVAAAALAARLVGTTTDGQARLLGRLLGTTR